MLIRITLYRHSLNKRIFLTFLQFSQSFALALDLPKAITFFPLSPFIIISLNYLLISFFLYFLFLVVENYQLSIFPCVLDFDLPAILTLVVSDVFSRNTPLNYSTSQVLSSSLSLRSLLPTSCHTLFLHPLQIYLPS